MLMKLLVNTATSIKGGSLQVAQSFLESCRSHPEHSYAVILSAPLAERVNPDDYPDNFTFVTAPYRPATRFWLPGGTSAFHKAFEAEVRPDVVFTTTGPAYFQPDVPHLVAYNLPHYIYPESPFFTQINLYRALRWSIKKRIIRSAYRNEATAIVGQSEDVAERAAAFLGIPNAHTVSNTCAAHFFEPPNGPSPLGGRDPQRFRLLLLSDYYAHKNFELIPHIVTVLDQKGGEDVDFVLTLGDTDYERLVPPALRTRIINVGRVPNATAPALYADTDAVFQPSMLECFSANYPEAMAMQRPIITADLGFARSLCKDAAVYFDPLDPYAAALQILRVKQDGALRRSLVEAGAAWLPTFPTADVRAEQYLALCEKLLAG